MLSILSLNFYIVIISLVILFLVSFVAIVNVVLVFTNAHANENQWEKINKSKEKTQHALKIMLICFEYILLLFFSEIESFHTTIHLFGFNKCRSSLSTLVTRSINMTFLNKNGILLSGKQPKHGCWHRFHQNLSRKKLRKISMHF